MWGNEVRQIPYTQSPLGSPQPNEEHTEKESIKVITFDLLAVTFCGASKIARNQVSEMGV